MYRTRRPFIVGLTVLTIVSIVGLMVAPAHAAVGPNPPGSSQPQDPGIDPGGLVAPTPWYEFDEAIPTVVEGQPGDTNTITFDLVASHPSPYDQYFQVSTTDHPIHASTPGVDFVEIYWQTVVLPAGELILEIEVEIIGDLLPESDEAVGVAIYQNGYFLDDTFGMILDDDPHVAYALSHARVAEGGPRGLTNLNFGLTASEPLDYDVTFFVTTQPGTATSGVDYVAMSMEPVVLPAGQTSILIPVRVIGDTLVEDDETLTLQVYRLDAANTWHLLQATGTIFDDDVLRRF
jgi:hypothetical protein